MNQIKMKFEVDREAARLEARLAQERSREAGEALTPAREWREILGYPAKERREWHDTRALLDMLLEAQGFNAGRNGFNAAREQEILASGD